jgi:hypothetical protein
MLESLMSEWEELLENMEYEPVHHALKAGITLLEKYYCRADDTDVYFIAHGRSRCLYSEFRLTLISLGSGPQARISQGCVG